VIDAGDKRNDNEIDEDDENDDDEMELINLNLSGFKNLEFLKLRCLVLNLKDMNFKKLTNLRHLWLELCIIENDNANFFKTFPNLQYVNLDCMNRPNIVKFPSSLKSLNINETREMT
jgi:hypothetical protein